MLKQLAVVSFVLQIIIPAGYMPAALSSGWFIQLCPEGLSPVAMQILHGGHVEHLVHEDVGPDASRYDCSFAGFVCELVGNSASSTATTLYSSPASYPADSPHFVIQQERSAYLSRAPPIVKIA